MGQRGTSRGAVTVERMDGAAAVRAQEAFRLIYAEAFAEPPALETEDDVAAAFVRFPALAGRPGFRAALARTEEGEPVGLAYGHPLPPDAVWWDELTHAVPDDLRREDGHRTFGLRELAVRGPWRGQGIARRLHETLREGLRAERMLLNVHPENTAATAAYRSWGYRAVGEARPGGTGAVPHRVMLLDLR
ncbi:GNAT family N-acetyltransferase [Streptomyces sp.]|uniref:GNAT family N-acetyltransferase n=1 Tax=Streptomyces sp. TaxID=1931 RepID=UPI002811A070|nr:GNAT family N-acetyltransferase [Streptomyces sp.]